MCDTFVYKGYTFKKIKSTDKERPYKVKCLETSDEKDSGCSYEAVADLIASPLEFSKNILLQKSQDINYVKNIFEEVLLGNKKSDCDELVENNIANANLIDGTIYYFTDKELFAEYKIYKTTNFEIKVLFQKFPRCKAEKIIITPLQQ